MILLGKKVDMVAFSNHSVTVSKYRPIVSVKTDNSHFHIRNVFMKLLNRPVYDWSANISPRFNQLNQSILKIKDLGGTRLFYNPFDIVGD